MAYLDPRVVCSPWVEDTKLCCAGDASVDDCATGLPVPLVYKWTDAELILAASNLLFARTCYVYPGLCSVTVWPCNDCHCNCHPCACGTWSKLDLPTDYPIQEITEVRIDGVALDPADYRLDRSQWLVRMDGERWPTCNSFALPNTSSSEIQVDMVVGREPPIELQIAAADLVCEIKRACNGSADCVLPPNVRSLVRRGVELEFENITDLFNTGQFGIPSVDMAIKNYGCHHHGSVYDPVRHFRGYGVS